MTISTLVVTDIDRFIGMKDFWDGELKDHTDDPFLLSCMLIEQWKLSQKLGWNPLLMLFVSSGEIIGFAPLLMRSNLGFRQVSNFDHYRWPDFFSDNNREVCIDKMLSFLFKQLNCESASLTFEDESDNLRTLQKVCASRGLKFTKAPQEGQAIIPITGSLNSYKESLKRKDRKEFERNGRKLDKLGSWQISCFALNHSSISKIWAIERFSWKANLEGKKKALKTLGLESILNGIQRNSESEPLFESEVWTLELNNLPLAYVVVMKRNKTVFFVKTSFDSRFKIVSPGMFLMNELIERVFENMVAEKIDFISNIPCVQVWKPLVKKRAVITILRNPSLSRARNLVFENRVSLKTSQITEGLVWKNKKLDCLV